MPTPPPAEPDRDLGPQPLAALLAEHNLRPQDLVSTRPTHLTHKLIARAAKGRRLTPHSQKLVLTALNTFTSKSFKLPDLFTY